MHNVSVTVDVDWAPDWAMRQLLTALAEEEVPSTWFVTHDTPVLDELRQRPDLFEIGIHPNFLPGSSHGNTPAEVMSECMRLAPEARAMRTHCLVQSTPILQTVVDTSPIRFDSSIYLRDATAVAPSPLPLDNASVLTRIPYVWEDDLEFFAESPRWDGRAFLEDRHDDDEITIVDVHPIHFALNSADIEPYRALKAAFGDTRTVSEADGILFRGEGRGAQTFVRSLISARAELDVDYLTVSGLFEDVQRYGR